MKNLLKAEPTRVIIPVSTAIERTTHWRNFMKNNVAARDDRKIPKAVYISKEDIEDMAEQCRADDTIAGVRAYFTLNTPYSEDIKNEVKFVMVLVKINDTKPFGDDIIYAPGVVTGEDGSKFGGGDDSNIYDFTKPCPDCCDPESPLFGGSV
ncbi:hypothetical protein [Mucilaginibacter segetis]|uniref:Uncharacterized protein n=1 Tax=Mucilaginibacter segetis TaxID=2793071 RepID=A0A934UMS0_9SPHI|nr:hypothetical protein [Mucilaginibacter segetis]MBK0379161.1 hypothetical protein [Mucilaginibacter segetis]